MNITTNEAYSFGPMPLGTQVCIQLSGDFDSGTASIGFIPTGGSFVPYSWPADGSAMDLTASGLVTVWAPYDALIAIDFNGAASAPDVVAHAWPVHFPTNRQF